MFLHVRLFEELGDFVFVFVSGSFRVDFRGLPFIDLCSDFVVVSVTFEM